MKKIGIVGCGFVGNAVNFGFTTNVEKFLVDPKLGTLDDFDEMLLALHEAGIRVFVDIVPNHSSNLHQKIRQTWQTQSASLFLALLSLRLSTLAVPPTAHLSGFPDAAA